MQVTGQQNHKNLLPHNTYNATYVRIHTFKVYKMYTSAKMRKIRQWWIPEVHNLSNATSIMVRIDSETLTIHDLNCPSKQQTNVKSNITAQPLFYWEFSLSCFTWQYFRKCILCLEKISRLFFFYYSFKSCWTQNLVFSLGNKCFCML